MINCHREVERLNLDAGGTRTAPFAVHFACRSTANRHPPSRRDEDATFAPFAPILRSAVADGRVILMGRLGEVYSWGYASFQENLAVAIPERIVHRVV